MSQIFIRSKYLSARTADRERLCKLHRIYHGIHHHLTRFRCSFYTPSSITFCEKSLHWSAERITGEPTSGIYIGCCFEGCPWCIARGPYQRSEHSPSTEGIPSLLTRGKTSTTQLSVGRTGSSLTFLALSTPIIAVSCIRFNNSCIPSGNLRDYVSYFVRFGLSARRTSHFCAKW
jgi:hypothetical protein